MAVAKHVSLDHPHYALIFTDKNGMPHKQFSPSLARDGPSIISDEVTSHFLTAIARNKRKCSEDNGKRRRVRPKAGCGKFPLATSTLIRAEGRSLRSYYEKAFESFQQTNCRALAKTYIKLIEPRKQFRYPYNGRVSTASGIQQLDPEVTKPPWWPSGVIHREPDHLLKRDRIELLVSILCDLHASHAVTVEKLRSADQAIRPHIHPPERLQILDEIYRVRGEEEKILDTQKGHASISTLHTLQHSTSSASKDHHSAYSNSLGQFHNYEHGIRNPFPTQFSRGISYTGNPKSTSNNRPEKKRSAHAGGTSERRSVEFGLRMKPIRGNEIAPTENQIFSDWPVSTINASGWGAASPMGTHTQGIIPQFELQSMPLGTFAFDSQWMWPSPISYPLTADQFGRP